MLHKIFRGRFLGIGRVGIGLVGIGSFFFIRAVWRFYLSKAVAYAETEVGIHLVANQEVSGQSYAVFVPWRFKGQVKSVFEAVVARGCRCKNAVGRFVETESYPDAESVAGGSVAEITQIAHTTVEVNLVVDGELQSWHQHNAAASATVAGDEAVTALKEEGRRNATVVNGEEGAQTSKEGNGGVSVSGRYAETYTKVEVLVEFLSAFNFGTESC